MFNSRLLTSIPLAILAASTSAQTDTGTSSNSTCKNIGYDADAPVNASAVIPVNITTAEPWYLTITLNDTRTDTTARTHIDGWISTPANSTGRTCVYWISELLPAQSSGAPNGACTGSLSESCIDFLQRSIQLSSGNCPNLPGRDSFANACSGSPLAEGTQIVSTAKPFDISNSTCSPSLLPGASQPPSSYINHGLFGIIFNGEHSDAQDPSKFTWYDRYATLPMPWLVAVERDGQTTTSVVCAVPGEVGKGGKTPGVSRAGKVGVGWLGLGMGVGVVMALL